MDLQSLKTLQLEDIYWIARFGLPKKKGTIYDLRQQSFENIAPPAFFLSTGRCGTKWFSRLIARDRSVKVLHAPDPTLAIQGKMVYENFRRGLLPEHKTLIREIYLSGRESYLRFAYKCSRRLIETNNYITFFAPILRELFPRAKFVHIYRHPGEFVRSGINRNYYTGKNSDDIKRIVPVNGSESSEWESYSQIQKVSWLWRETNHFIEAFKQDLDAEHFMSINFNALDMEKVHELSRFLEADIRPSFITKELRKRVNVQKRTIKEPFSQWKQEEKRQLDQIAGDLARQYGYKI